MYPFVLNSAGGLEPKVSVGVPEGVDEQALQQGVVPGGRLDNNTALQQGVVPGGRLDNNTGPSAGSSPRRPAR